ncbi:MAG: CinA family protein [Nocardiopsaceae bacterium]|nr:CinA family protein [Nocardiopsaceae bacterium]
MTAVEGEGPGGLPEAVIASLVAGGLTVGAAESLTGGLVTAALTSVPGSSAAVRGGIVAYAADLKNALLGVDADLLERVGTVHADVALAMARGARERLGASVGVATTGVAGPDPSDGQPVGTVHIAVCTAGLARHEALTLNGDRAEIRRATVDRVLKLLVATLRETTLRETTLTELRRPS